MMDPIEKVVPLHHSGIQTNTENSIEATNQKDALTLFEKVKQRLLNVNEWHHFAGTPSAEFQLTDDKGNEVQRPIRKGDHFKINIPAPKSVSGEGSDWVRVEEVEMKKDQDLEWVAIHVRPATNPGNELKDVAHFFTNEATSSFVVRREGNTITAGVYGRNEKPNTETEKVIDKIRNTAVAAGAISGFAKLQWKGLVNGLTDI